MQLLLTNSFSEPFWHAVLIIDSIMSHSGTQLLLWTPILACSYYHRLYIQTLYSEPFRHHYYKVYNNCMPEWLTNCMPEWLTIKSIITACQNGSLNINARMAQICLLSIPSTTVDYFYYRRCDFTVDRFYYCRSFLQLSIISIFPYDFTSNTVDPFYNCRLFLLSSM